ncbi:MAG TPA: GNAT family N-acetyltransferase [Bryobacteraceae bacterium]|nr:GNAT family N-acetyltransferase [Bryobacteraceae bacterium]
MTTAAPVVTIRRAKPEDAAVCGPICYEAFRKINTDHNFPPDVPSVEAGVGILTSTFSHPGFYCVVAESDGRIIGSNCLDERGPIAGVGPITVDPTVQNRGAGRKLMAAVMDRARERNFAGVRLVQAAFHNRSLSLYTTLGFDVREPLEVMQGPAIKKTYVGFAVRPVATSDLDACNRLALRVHGHERGGELADAIGQGTAVLVERDGRITGYASAFAFFGHAVAETTPDLQAMIAAADGFAGPGILVPSRNSELFRWCLGNGLRVVLPMTLMSVGLYNEPKGAFLPSVLY